MTTKAHPISGNLGFTNRGNPPDVTQSDNFNKHGSCPTGENGEEGVPTPLLIGFLMLK